MKLFGHRPTFPVPFSLSGVQKALKEDKSIITELKYNGINTSICVNSPFEGSSSFTTKTGNIINSLYYLKASAAPVESYWCINGEIVSNVLPVEKLSGLIRTLTVNSSNKKYHYPITDELYSKQFCLDPKFFQIRVFNAFSVAHRDISNIIVNTKLIPQAIDILKVTFPQVTWLPAEYCQLFTIEQVQSHFYDTTVIHKHEGLILKKTTGKCTSGKNPTWWKYKKRDTMDGHVVGLNWGTPGLSTENKVIGFKVLLENKMIVKANNLSLPQMNQITTNVNSHGPNYYNNWACEVNYQDLTTHGSLRHPSFKCFRGTEDNPTEKI